MKSLAPLLPRPENSHFKGRGSRNKYEMSWIFGAPASQAWKIVTLKCQSHEIYMICVESLTPLLSRLQNSYFKETLHEINSKCVESLAPLLSGLQDRHYKGRGSRNKYERCWIFGAPAARPEKLVTLKGEARRINMKWVESLAPLLPRPAEQSL